MRRGRKKGDEVVWSMREGKVSKYLVVGIWNGESRDVGGGRGGRGGGGWGGGGGGGGGVFFFFQAEDGIRDIGVTGVQTCALPIYFPAANAAADGTNI